MYENGWQVHCDGRDWVDLTNPARGIVNQSLGDGLEPLRMAEIETGKKELRVEFEVLLPFFTPILSNPAMSFIKPERRLRAFWIETVLMAYLDGVPNICDRDGTRVWGFVMKNAKQNFHAFDRFVLESDHFSSSPATLEAGAEMVAALRED